MSWAHALHKLNAGRQYRIVGGGENFGCGALFWEQCALFPCFLWQPGLPPPFYGGIGEVRPLIRDGPLPYKDPLHCLLYYWAPHMDPSWALLHHHLRREWCFINISLHSIAIYISILGRPPALKGFSCTVSCIIGASPYMEPAVPTTFVIVEVIMAR